jgi:hypothetical protein
VSFADGVVQLSVTGKVTDASRVGMLLAFVARLSARLPAAHAELEARLVAEAHASANAYRGMDAAAVRRAMSDPARGADAELRSLRRTRARRRNRVRLLGFLCIVAATGAQVLFVMYGGPSSKKAARPASVTPTTELDAGTTTSRAPSSAPAAGPGAGSR